MARMKALTKRKSRNARSSKKVFFVLFSLLVIIIVLCYFYLYPKGYIVGIKSLNEWGSANIDSLIKADESRYIKSLSEDSKSKNKLTANNGLEKVEEFEEPSIAEPSEYRKIDRDYLNNIIEKSE